MSISTSLSNALSGLTAAARQTEVISSNISNALTPGYGRRRLELSADSLAGRGAGVRIDGVTRTIDRFLLADRRIADAAAADSGMRTNFLDSIEKAIGAPGESGSLSSLLSALDVSFVQAASRPDSQARLQQVVTAGNALAAKLNALSDTIQQARMAADDDILRQIDDLNESLSRIDQLNADILALHSSGSDATALMDLRQREIDHVATIVPTREASRSGEQVALYTTGGAVLLDGNPAKIGFSPVGTITADMTLSSGDLSGLTINGMSIQTGDGGPLSGGTLGALFAVSDTLAPDAQMQVDAFARDLLERFQQPTVDPTLLVSQPGLFTDNGAVADPQFEAGLSGRIKFTSLCDPAKGGALWRLRDGLGALVPGDVGNGALLSRYSETLAQKRVPASAGFAGTAKSADGFVADVLSNVSSKRQSAEASQSYASARQASLKQQELQAGVDTDAELQHLLQVEQAYAANSRVIQTIDDMMKQLIDL